MTRCGRKGAEGAAPAQLAICAHSWAHFLHTAAHARNSVSELGADGPDVLRGLGLGDDAIDALATEGVLHLPASAAAAH